MISRKFSAWRSRSSDSRPVIRLPRSTAARRRAEAAKNGALPLLEAPGGRKATYNQALER